MAEVPTPQVNKPPTNVEAPSTKSRNVVIAIIVVLVVLIVLASIWFVLTSLGTTQTTTTPTTTSTEEGPAVQGDKDLQKLEEEVRGTDVDSLENTLQENDKDAAEF